LKTEESTTKDTKNTKKEKGRKEIEIKRDRLDV